MYFSDPAISQNTSFNRRVSSKSKKQFTDEESGISHESFLSTESTFLEGNRVFIHPRHNSLEFHH